MEGEEEIERRKEEMLEARRLREERYVWGLGCLLNLKRRGHECRYRKLARQKGDAEGEKKNRKENTCTSTHN